MRHRLGPCIVFALFACTPPALPSPSDDPADWPVEAGRTWTPVIGEPTFVVPARNLPAEVTPRFASNNNVDIVLHDGTLFMGWRTAETHFASANTRLHVVSSKDLGQTWSYEQTVHLGADMREPLFLSFRNRLWFHFFEAGVDRFNFEPKHQWRQERTGPARWTERVPFSVNREITWSLKVRGGVAYRTSYIGNHYDLSAEEPPDVRVSFTRSTDGETWSPVSGDGVVYRGGVSEVAFELDETGGLWAVTRNEDGDSTGFGSHVCTAPAGDLGTWTCSATSDPERYDSPKMFRHGTELFLVARRDVGGPFDRGDTMLPFKDKQTQYLAAYSSRPKRTALYRIDRDAKKVVWVADLPSMGDTSFPSIVRLDAHRFVVANYTSPIEGDPNQSWWYAQNAEAGTRIYLVEIRFDPR